MPFDFVDSDADGGGDGSREKQRQLARSGEGVHAESQNREEKYGDQRDDGDERKPYGRKRHVGMVSAAVVFSGRAADAVFGVFLHDSELALSGVIN